MILGHLKAKFESVSINYIKNEIYEMLAQFLHEIGTCGLNHCILSHIMHVNTNLECSWVVLLLKWTALCRNNAVLTSKWQSIARK